MCTDVQGPLESTKGPVKHFCSLNKEKVTIWVGSLLVGTFLLVTKRILPADNFVPQ